MSQEITPQHSHTWIVVYVTYNVHEAQIMAGRLDSEGIRALVHQEAGASAMGIHIGRLGEIKLLVHPDHYETALNILFPDKADALPDDTDRVVFDLDEDTEADDDE